MALSLEQEERYITGQERWEWSVWVEGSGEELDQIDHVTYVLHKTFPNPVREIHDRATKFRLDTAGWGTFTIYAKAVRRDGTEIPLQHELVLRYPDGTPTAA
jgi:transcription initiation factor IIF auxiliary subunit